MIRRLIWALIWVVSSGTVLAAPGASPACLYESRAFSEGAFVCVQKSLMQVCIADGGRMIWKTVPDRDINDRCTVPTVPHYRAEERVRPLRRQVLFRRFHAPLEAPAKCFFFNGRQYCE